MKGQLENEPIAIVGLGAILPDAKDAPSFWENIVNKRYSITDVEPTRWDPKKYYDPDPKALDKTYSKIGGWVKDYEFDWKRFRIPPRVADVMDPGQHWAVEVSAAALEDAGYPDWKIDSDRVGVVYGASIGGEYHYVSTSRIHFPEFEEALRDVEEFAALPESSRDSIIRNWHANFRDRTLEVTEDTMPGELPNIVSGRVANVLNLRGPNFITDAACASSFAGVQSAVQLLREGQIDAVVTGGVDRNMGPSSFVKFCKIGALSPSGSRPFGKGADGFIMGEGAASFILKRLVDAERDGDRIYAVIRGIGGASDGKGKGITAPNPIGQQLAMRRAWAAAGLDPGSAGLIEAHGTSTRVGDVVEVKSLSDVFAGQSGERIALGSVKSNFGHLKAAAGAAGMLKAAYAIHHGILPPTLNAEPANPEISLDATPLFLNHEAREWEHVNGVPRRAGVSAYGFGGTNFHLVMEEYVPGMLDVRRAMTQGFESTSSPTVAEKPLPLRGILALGADTPDALLAEVETHLEKAESGWSPDPQFPLSSVLQSNERLLVDFGNTEELTTRLQRALKAMGSNTPRAWAALQSQGVFRGTGSAPGKIAFLFPGQGSQYLNMGRELSLVAPTVSEVFEEADRIMTPILGKPLTGYLFSDSEDEDFLERANEALRQTEITQPAMLTFDNALMKLLGVYGFEPDMVMGHSLGEYAAVVAAGVMPFGHALEAVAARGNEMSRLDIPDNGKMAAVMAPSEEIEDVLAQVDGYVVTANINSSKQNVIGGSTEGVDKAIEILNQREIRTVELAVSHAFHTKIVEPGGIPLRKVFDRLSITSPSLPIVANITGTFYPTGVEEIKDTLQTQISSPVQWIKGLQTLYDSGVRTFIEVGPKRALQGFVREMFDGKDDVVSLMTNLPRVGEAQSFNQAICGLLAAGYQPAFRNAELENMPGIAAPATGNGSSLPLSDQSTEVVSVQSAHSVSTDRIEEEMSVEDIRSMIAEAVRDLGVQQQPAPDGQAFDRNLPPKGSIVISGTGLGIPGAEKPLMASDNAERILRGEQFIDLIPERFRKRMVEKRIVRVVKAADGSGSLETIDSADDTIKLAGRPGPFDLSEDYGIDKRLVEALDMSAQVAFAAGVEALQNAGIPLVMVHKPTTTGKHLPDRWMLPEALRDETGVIFASAFPGIDRFADELTRFHRFSSLVGQIEELESLRSVTTDHNTLEEIGRRIGMLREKADREDYTFDRRFLFRILTMGHSQFAQHIGARGPNTHVNAACASTTQAVGVAEDWIRSGRCRRVIVIAGDDITTEGLMEWMGAGFLALGAAATDDRVEDAALPFDLRRHGMLIGMGSCALVVETEDAVRERGMRGVTELLGTEYRNSAFHPTRLDVNHIAGVMDSLVTSAERRFGINRHAMAENLVFVSHETYTPARGGSASAEVVALRQTFGDSIDRIVISNTKGFTGHAMGVGVEDVIALKILEHGVVPPVPNFRDVDPDLGRLNLSRGGRYPVQYALHLAAGFGSQIAFSLTRRIPGGLDRKDNPAVYQQWLDRVSGYDRATTEIVNHSYRVVDQGIPTRQPGASTWIPGTGPVVRAVAPGSPVAASMPLPAALKPLPAPRPVLSAPPPPPVPAAPKPQVAPAPIISQPIASPPPKPVVPAPAPTPVAPAVEIQPDGSDVSAKVLALVAEQTGYPVDMLALDLDLEADLGIDTVKQAETFSAIREEFDIPFQEDLSLRDYPTLEAVIGFVHQFRPDLKDTESAAVSTPVQPEVAVVSAGSDDVKDHVLGIVAEQTGYPVDMLALDLDLEADLGIDTVKQAETFSAIREAFDIPFQEDLSLRDYPTLEAVIGFVHQFRPDLKPAATPASADPPASVPAAPTPPAPPVAPVALAATVETAPVAPAVSMDAADPVSEQVLLLVSEQTGYPPDMLELDLDLEADLGIDTVKQAETFSAIREAFDIPFQEDLSLRDYPTLEAVIGFVHQFRPDLKPAKPVSVAPTPPAPAATPAAQPVAAAPEVAVSPASAVGNDPVSEQVLALVSEQTGYPPDMLELDLDLEADLGIDTVKQAETFSAIREAFDIPFQEDLSLRDYPTLAAVIGFVHEFRPDLKPASPVSVAPTPPAPAATPAAQPVATAPAVAVAVSPAPAGESDPVSEQVLALVSEQTGYPPDMLELDLDLEADLGIDTVKQAETFSAIREAFDIPFQEDLSLRDYPTLAAVIGFVHEFRPDLKPTAAQVVPPPTVVTPAVPTASDPPAPVAVAQAPVSERVDVVTAQVLDIVADQTGYPIDMLEPDLDLEADLGIDTVKQAETFSAIRETFDIPFQEDLSLRDYPTLASVVGFVREFRPDLVDSTTDGAEASTSPAESATKRSVAETKPEQVVYSIDDADKFPRRVVVPVPRPAIDCCLPTGTEIKKGSRILVVSDKGGVGKALTGRLKKLGAEVLALDSSDKPEDLEKTVTTLLSNGAIQGVYWLPGLDVEGLIEDLSFDQWKEEIHRRIKSLSIVMRLLYESVAGSGTFLVAGTRMGGRHGYEEGGASAPMGGAICGFCKAYKREHAEVTVKVVDMAPGRKTTVPAEMLIAETLSDPGVVEVGYKDDERYSLSYIDRPANDGTKGLALGADSVVVVTGAAGGITSEIVGDLAQASKGIFYLLDLTPAPDAGDIHISSFRQGRDVLRDALIAEAKEKGERPTPVLIDKAIMDVERREAALRAIEMVESAGGTANYRSVNLLDHEAVTAVVAEIREHHPRIDALVHAGGLEISKPLDKKDAREFNLVFDVKADGFFSLLNALKGFPVGATVVFSSVAGRFGNAGQTDYSAANDLLCKISSSFRSWRPDTRGIAIDWTAWGGIGMATRGSIPKIMEMAGIDMLPPEAGVPTVRRELTAGAFRGEIVVGGALGILAADWDPTGGIDLASFEGKGQSIVGVPTGAGLHRGYIFSFDLDPNEQAYLYDHAIDGTPLLPGVMGVELFTQTALAAVPGSELAAVMDVSYLSPFKFYRMQPQTLHIEAKPVIENGNVVVETRLLSRRTLPGVDMPPQEKLHFIGRVALGDKRVTPEKSAFKAPAAKKLDIESGPIYEVYFHGPAYQVLEKAYVEGPEAVGLFASALPAATKPDNLALAALPRLIELCYQTAGIWGVRTEGEMALPAGFESVTIAPPDSLPKRARLYARVRVSETGETFDADVLDKSGNVYVALRGYRTIKLPGKVSI